MTQVLGGIRSILQFPLVYRTFTSVIGAPHARQEFVARYVRPEPGDRVLDMGCGTAELVDFLPETDYVGFDISEEYVRAASRRHGRRARFLHAGVGDPILTGEPPFDLAIAFGVLHHLDDAMADRLFAQARMLLEPGGRLITFDGCWAAGQSRIAHWLLSRDRGKAIRTAEELERLARPHFADVRSEVRHDFLRIPYTHVVLECRADHPAGRDN